MDKHKKYLTKNLTLEKENENSTLSPNLPEHRVQPVSDTTRPLFPKAA